MTRSRQRVSLTLVHQLKCKKYLSVLYWLTNWTVYLPIIKKKLKKKKRIHCNYINFF